MNPVLRQIHARPQVGDIAETTSPEQWLANEDTGWTANVTSGDFKFTQRLSYQEEAGVNANVTPLLYYSKNGGTWTRVDASSSNVRSASNSVWADEVTTTEQLTAGTGSFQAGEGDDVDGACSSQSILKDEYTEMIFSIILRNADLVDGDTIELRIQNGQTSPGSFDFYDAASLPDITIQVDPLLTQRAFRFVLDGSPGAEATATFAAALNTDFTGDRDTTYRCRLGIDNTGGPNVGTVYRIQKSIDEGAWSDLAADDADVRLVLSSNFADGDATTERLAGAQTFVAGSMIEGSGTDVADSTSIDIDGSQETEIEFAFDCTGLKGSQTVDFRAIPIESPENVLDNYVETPRFTVDSTAAQTVLRTTFSTPSSAPFINESPTKRKQIFRAYVRRDSENLGTGTPNVDFFLYEGGVQKEVLDANISVTSDTGEVVEARWDAANLATADGSDVEVRIVGDVGGAGINARTVEFGAVEWCVEHEVDGAGITGTVNVTLGDDTLAASGDLEYIGSVAVTLGDDTLAASGTPIVDGSVNVSLGDDTLAASGTPIVDGSVNVSLDDDTLAASGTPEIIGTVSVTLGDDTLAAQLFWFDATLSETLGDDTLAASGLNEVVGTVDSTLGDDTLTASGSVADETTGTLAVTLEDDTLTASGDLEYIGSLAVTLGDDTLAASGTVEVVGSVAVTLGDATLAATGEWFDGTVNVSLGDDTLAASGLNEVIGALGVTLGDDTLAATGEWFDGTLSVALGDDTLVASGLNEVVGTVNVSLEDDTLVASGNLEYIASLAVTLEDDTLVASGTITVSGDVDATFDTQEGDDTLAASGTVENTGTLSETLGDDTLTATGEWFEGTLSLKMTRLRLLD
jgi:hypothetical protein